MTLRTGRVVCAPSRTIRRYQNASNVKWPEWICKQFVPGSRDNRLACRIVWKLERLTCMAKCNSTFNLLSRWYLCIRLS